MDIQRLFLFLIFSFSLVLVWDGWQRYQHPENFVAQQSSPIQTKDSVAAIKSSNIANQATALKETALAQGKIIHVKTDLIEADINTLGGDIQHLKLLKHPDGQDKNKPLELFQRGQDSHNYVAQTGLLGTGMPNHNTVFMVEQDKYELSGNADAIKIKLSAISSDGVKVVKVMTFHKSSYLIDIAYEIENGAASALNTSAYFQFVRDGSSPGGDSMFVPTYTGPAVYTDKEKFQKVDFASIDGNKTEYPKESDDGWIAMLQHYFVAAWLPADKLKREYFTKKLDNGLYAVGIVIPMATVDSGMKNEISVSLYAGPAQSTLDKIAPGLGLTVDYGWLTIFATPIFWLMSVLNDLVNNWGVAIILLTILIKLAFFPLSAASYRSMGKMRVVAPKLEKIKQRYADDREGLNRAMMELYKTEKINPLGGCLPVLVQIPVFIALYWAILASVELRYAPFFGWITDLSAADPYYILPVIMGLSMLIQSKLNPVPPDPIQAKVMQIMPILFSVIFFFFPAGLVLYSIVNNALSIAQQWYINRMLEAESLAVKH